MFSFSTVRPASITWFSLAWLCTGLAGTALAVPESVEVTGGFSAGVFPRDGVDLLVRNPAAKGEGQNAVVFYSHDAPPAVGITKKLESKIVNPNTLNFTYSKTPLPPPT